MHPTSLTEIPGFYKNKRLSILLPFLNEQDIIVANARKVLQMTAGWDIKVEIILIDDGSTDQSYPLLEQAFKKDKSIKLVRNHQNFGKGWALKTGYEFSTGDLILFLDSDLELSPAHLPNFLRIMNEEGADVVIGSKRHPDSELDYPAQRKLMSNVYYILIRILFGLPVRDTQTGIKLFKREALEIALPRLLVKRFAFDIELLLLMHKYDQKIATAPIQLNFSRVAAGRMKLKTVFNMLWDTMAIFYRNTILRFYNRPIGVNHKYSYTFILFSHLSDEYEKKSLTHYLSINYPEYRVIYCGPADLGIQHEKLSYIHSELDSFAERFRLVMQTAKLDSDYLVFSTLDAYPDERYLFPAARQLSLPDVEIAGGFVNLSRPHTEFELQSFLAIRSFFLNAHLAYRYQARHTRITRELPLDGLFVHRDSLKDLGWESLSSRSRLEHILCQHILKQGKKVLYVPDLMLYKRFPQDMARHLGVIRHHALTRGRLHSIWTLLAILLSLGLDAGVIVAIIQNSIIPALPAVLFYSFMLISRIFLSGMRRGVLNFGLLMISQFVYGIHFLKGFFSRAK